MNTFDPPKGSQIKVKNDFEGITLFWKKPSGGVFRHFIVLFLLFWLCGWFFGLVSAGKEVLVGKGGAFLVFWLAGWTIGGVFVVGLLFLLLRPQAPESVTLERNRMKYDTGSAPMHFFNIYWMMNRKMTSNPFATLFQKRKIFEFNKSDYPEFVLEGLGDDQRLRFDDGADRVVIGESLKEPEREWLAQLLITWRAG